MICSLVSHWEGASDRVAKSKQVLAQVARVEMGEAVGNRQPLVITVDDPGEANELTDWITHLDGVTFVDVVYVHFEETPANLTAVL